MEPEEGIYVDLTDEEGNNFKLEYIDELELDGRQYRIFLPTDMAEDDPDYGLILLRVVTEGGEELLDSIDDDEEMERVYNAAMEQLFNDDEE